MNRAVVIIPNYNGLSWLEACLKSLERQTVRDFTTLLVDNGSTDGSVAYVREHFPQVKLLCLEENTGFAGAVNAGIRAGEEPYVILLNNDTRAASAFVEELIRAIEQKENIFSCSARMLSMGEPDKIDDAGDLLCALGWAFARGKGKDQQHFHRPKRIFAACGGAAIYRRSILEEIGLFSEDFFAYLEDIDLGWRAAAAGYENHYAPGAAVLHHGSASSGSRYNAFKARLTGRNNLWLIYRNMPAWQMVLNSPLLLAGFVAKIVFYLRKGLGTAYLSGMAEALSQGKKIDRPGVHLGKTRYHIRLQLDMWVNLIRRIGG